MSYIGKHWRGELSLGISFWVNFFLLNIGIRIIEIWFTKVPPIEHPVTAAWITTLYITITLAIVYPWQIIGLWRSCNANKILTRKWFWPHAVKNLIVLSFIITLININTSWPLYKYLGELAFVEDEFGNFKVQVIKDGSFIHVRGGLGFGVSEEVAELVKRYPDLQGIILDSNGGRIYEGRELSKLILINGLDTYSLEGCYSACMTAFISGKKRYLGKGANLAFHQYRINQALEPYFDIDTEQTLDLRVFYQQGINKDFLDRLFITTNRELWYPTIEEMLNAGVIHAIVNPSLLTPVDYLDEPFDLERFLLGFPSYKTIKQYDPKTFDKLMASVSEVLNMGGTTIELQETVSRFTADLAMLALPQSSNESILKWTQVIVDNLRMLEQKDPIFCMKNLFPDEYGPLVLARFFSDKERASHGDVLDNILLDGYKGENQKLERFMAEQTVEKVVLQLGEEAAYLEASGLQNKSDYSKTCNAFIKFYQLILAEEEGVAANALRYIYSQE